MSNCFLFPEMESLENNLIISDKVWILVGMLLRQGHSCTPSELADRCHIISFSSSEIECLCKIPLSPLSLSKCGKVTLSQFLFRFFDGVRRRFTVPVKTCIWQNNLHEEILKTTKSSGSLDSPEIQQQKSPLKCPNCKNPKIPSQTVSKPNPGKRCHEETYLPPSKKQNVSGCIQRSAKDVALGNKAGDLGSETERKVKDAPSFVDVPVRVETQNQDDVLIRRKEDASMQCDAPKPVYTATAVPGTSFRDDAFQGSVVTEAANGMKYQGSLQNSPDDKAEMDNEGSLDLEECNGSAEDAIDHEVVKPTKSRIKPGKGLRQKVDHGKLGVKVAKFKKTAKNLDAGAACSLVVDDKPTEEKFPTIHGFVLESVVGSGGYGTVYKAVRKHDGNHLAIKYPFEKTSCKYVQNEIKVLQKYGGQSFIPKCVEVIDESGRLCLVMDYIEHDKPEVLKKEITISELQSYGLSLFKALEYLHSKGVIHRDVKPGNFLFSRQKQCGWLVDFNLATVQQKLTSGPKLQKYASERMDMIQYDHNSHQSTVGTPNQGKYSSRSRGKHVELQEKGSTPICTPTRDAKLSTSHIETTPNQQWKKPQVPESSIDTGTHGYPKLSPAARKVPSPMGLASGLKGSRQNMHFSPLVEQTKHSVDTHSADPMMPRFGRRELWDLVQKNQQTPQPSVPSIPSTYKKRVAAPPKRKLQKVPLEQSLLQSSKLPATKLTYAKNPDIGHMQKARAVQKMKKEGPCAGTKGYRAPEVLMKSTFQSEKIDIWSAGVSLFQLLLGKSPFSFSSSLEQSLVDIAQFTGTEAICNLAKDHNREVSLCKELLSSEFQPVSIHQWCEKNIKRSELLSQIPPSLYNLLEKCLQADPRSRISAKEALQHEFFKSSQTNLQ